MASGYFPVEKDSEYYDEFGDIIIKLKSLHGRMLDDAFDNNQFDNAVHDGAYWERVGVALEMLVGVIRL